MKPRTAVKAARYCGAVLREVPARSLLSLALAMDAAATERLGYAADKRGMYRTAGYLWLVSRLLGAASDALDEQGGRDDAHMDR